MQLKINKEYKNLVPRLEADNYETLKASIKKNGIRTKLHCLDDGTILCGHTRFQIANELNIKDIPYEIVKLEGRDNILLYIIEDNLHRRQLTTIQKCMLGDILEPIYARINKSKKLATLKKGNIKPDGSQCTPTEQRDETNRSTYQVAKAIGVGSKTVQRYKKLKIEKTEVIEKIEAGKTSINKEYKNLTTERKVPNMPFRQTHISLITKGIKTQTSRQRNQWIKGDKVQVVMYEPKQAEVVIEKIERKKLSEFSEADAKREGGYTLEEFKRIWIEINGKWNENQVVNVIQFKEMK